MLIKVLFGVYSCHLIYLYFYYFPESTDFPHFIFHAFTSGGSVLFQKLPIAHLAASSTCVSLGSLPTQELSLGCNLTKSTCALCVKLLTLNTLFLLFLKNSPSGFSYNVFRKVLHQRRNHIIFSNELFLELNGWRL